MKPSVVFSLWRILTALALLRAAAAVFAAVPAAKSDNPWFRPPITTYYDEGKYIYERNCILCHGITGKGDGELVRGQLRGCELLERALYCAVHHSLQAGRVVEFEAGFRGLNGRVGLRGFGLHDGQR